MPPLHSVSSDYKALLCPLPITQSQPATKQSQPTERDSGSIIHQYTRKGHSRDTMDQEYNYFVRVQLILPLIGSLVVCGMGLTIRFLKPDKAVRIMFPHINKHGNNTVMFGFILKKEYTHALFAIMLVNVFFTALVFWIHLVIDRSRKYNPFGDYKCFYSSNHNEVMNVTLEEALTFDEDVECFSWTLNIRGAVGQATGTLLFAWVLVSVVTWIILNTAYKVNEFIKNKSLGWTLNIRDVIL